MDGIRRVYSVSQVNRYIKRLIENDIFLEDLYIEAEISNFKNHTSGHLFFTLKDSIAAVNAVMYRSNAENLKFVPENGMSVVVRGYLSLYEKTGQYQFYAKTMEPAGRGALFIAFEKLKERLERAGLFDEKHKKPIPPMPKTVAVVTSPTGAAVRDIIRIAGRRNPGVRIAVFPALVQGGNSAQDIARAIREVNAWGEADVLIVGRGGGSIEDLWSFNEEIVARAIFESKVPVISAVGHETDFTISDFIADLRASTPSAAAEIAVPNADDINTRVGELYNRLEKCMTGKISSYSARYNMASGSYILKNFYDKILNDQIYNQQLYKNLNSVMENMLSKNKLVLSARAEKIENISPLNILKKGYSIVYKDGKAVKSADAVKSGDFVSIRLYEGELKAEIIEKD